MFIWSSVVRRNMKNYTSINAVLFFSFQGAVINPFWMYRSQSVSVWKNRLLVKTLEIL